MEYKLPDLPYEYGDLEPFIDRTTMMIHHTKHHDTYVQKLNTAVKDRVLTGDIDELMRNIGVVPEDIKTAVTNFGGGHWNHTFFLEYYGTSIRNGA